MIDYMCALQNDTQGFFCVPVRVGSLSPREHKETVEWGPSVGFHSFIQLFIYLSSFQF